MTLKNIGLFTALVLFLPSVLFAQKISRQDYVDKYKVLAIKEMTRSGVPASITMAQACLESGDGNSELARKSNNHFGIKCKSTWKGKKVYYDDDTKNECFRKYKSVEESFIDHTHFLLDNYRYASLFKLAPTNYKAWARGLKKAGYATDPNYAHRLISIIEEYNLHLLDDKRIEPVLASFEQRQIGNDNTVGLTINPFHTRKVELRNGLKSVVVRPGDSFETIAQEFDMKSWELYKFNDYRSIYRPQVNEIIYIQPKKSKTAKNQLTYKAEAGETMHYISQMFGIKLKPLLRRNKMRTGEQPQIGQLIQLRKKKN